MQKQKTRRIAFGILTITATFWLATFVTGAAVPSAGNASSGQELYNQQCAKCHGADGKGVRSLNPPDFTNAKWQSSQSDKDLLDSISNGAGMMPGYKGSLSARQIASLVRQVRAFGAKGRK